MAETNLFDGKAITKEQFFEGGLEIPFINKFSEKIKIHQKDGRGKNERFRTYQTMGDKFRNCLLFA